MLRSRHTRLKIMAVVISVLILITYLVQKSHRDDHLPVDYFSNISWLFSPEAVQSELSGDISWLRAETAQDLSIASMSDEFKTRVESAGRRLGKQSYLIVEYTNVFFVPKFCAKTSEEIFNSPIERCEYQNCVYSCDKSEEGVRNADLLLFHQRDLEAELKNKYQSSWTKWLESTDQLPFKKPETKLGNNPEQIWVMWNDEATRVDPAFNKISNLFNWTLSFRTTSEIYRGSYGFLMEKKGLGTSDYVQLKRNVFTNEFLERKNAILWFVSNCKSKERLKIALEISKYYPVYIYGKCDDDESLAMSSNSLYRHLNIVKSECAPDSACEAQQFKGYKYYMAFENTNCSDYVTEKVWRSLAKSIIPIVLQPTRESYTRYRVPSRSIIHLQDFGYDAARLAQYLRKVDASFQLYYNHLKWTSVYSQAFYVNKQVEPHRMCELCRMLNTFDPMIYYDRLADFFNYKCGGK